MSLYLHLLLRSSLCVSLREYVTLLSVDGEHDDGDEDDREADQNRDQEIHVQIQCDHCLDEFGITTCKNEGDIKRQSAYIIKGSEQRSCGQSYKF